MINHNKYSFIVFIDRDGTIIEERHYLSDPDQVELIPDAAHGLRQFRAMGFGLIVVTNQSGISRGYFDIGRLNLIHKKILRLLEAEGAYLDRFYYCPHMPEHNCCCRKPQTGLVELAAKELNFNLERCVVIGDKASDIEMGQQVGATTLLVRTGYGSEVEKDNLCRPDYSVGGLTEAADVIQTLINGEEPFG